MKKDLSPLKSRIRDYLSIRGVAYNQSKKTYRCPNPSHADEDPSAVVYDNTHLLYCPVCNEKYDIFKVAELLDNEPDFKKNIASVENTLCIVLTEPHKEKPKAEKKPDTKHISIPKDKIGEEYKKQKEFFAKVGRENHWGELKTAWQYTDINGDCIALDIRYEDETGQKDVITWYYNGKGWTTRNSPHIIYNLFAAANTDKPILIVEGAKCARIGNDNLSEYFICVSWNGGANKSHLPDWSIFKNRECFMLPDDDHKIYDEKHKLRGQEKPPQEQPGTKAALEIKKQLPQLKIIKPLDEARTIKADGADIEEVLKCLSIEDTAAYILNPENIMEFSEESETEPQGQPEITVPSAPTVSDSSEVFNNTICNDGKPFKILGIGDDGRAYFIGHDGRFTSEKLTAINSKFLRTLAPIASYWSSEYPTKKGVDWETAESDVVLESQMKDFDKDILRGRGAWRDNDNFVYHDGITTTGIKSDKYMYLRLRKKDIGINDEPIDAATSREIAKIVLSMSFQTKTDAARCLAWSALAPFAGALLYRPSILLTGESGSGKSTIQKNIIWKLTNCYTGDAETTAAGMRSRTAKDSSCWFLDEAEKSTDKQKQNIDDVLSFMRSNFSDDSPDITKGTKDGGYINYKMNSMFGLAAIDPTIEKAADQNRIFRINVIMPTKEQSKEWSATNSKRLKQLMTDENCRKIRAHVWQNLRNIENLIEPISFAIMDKTGKSLRNSETDTYLLAAFIVIWEHNVNPTKEEIDAAIEKYYRYSPPDETHNEAEEFIDKYLDTIVEVLHDGKREKITLRECITREYNEYMIDENNDPQIFSNTVKKVYRETAGRYGLRLFDKGSIAIANNHNMIKDMMKCSSGYSEILKRHFGFMRVNERNSINVMFPDRKQRQCTILNGILTKKEGDKTDDEKLMDLIG